MSEYHPHQFVERFQHAVEVAIQSNPQGGLSGFELEWNMLDSNFWPLLTVGSGPNRISFVDFIRNEVLSPTFRQYSQLEVYHWMIEWATRPYYNLAGAVYEARVLEGILINTLHRASAKFGERFYYLHGNLLFQPQFGKELIPGSWNLAKRRYLERCVDMYGAALATAGIHTNLSLPEPLLSWDFVHQEQDLQRHLSQPFQYLDEYKNYVYIRATRLMRAFAALFIATTASTPFISQYRNGKQVIVLSKANSVRNLTFPNPILLDVPGLYRSHQDYLRISYELVQKGIRFGNNNWTPVRARSFAEPVERLISITSDQLHQLYAKGLYTASKENQAEEMARQIEMQNLFARINLPMARVEIRTDEGGHDLETDIANLVFKYLLLLRFYSDPEFAVSFRYDNEDIERARRNEEKAAWKGLDAEIENPLTAKPIGMREFLKWCLDEVMPLAQDLELASKLEPLVEMAKGAMNTSEKIRQRVLKDLGEVDEIPLDYLQKLAEEREEMVKMDIQRIQSELNLFNGESQKLQTILQKARDEFRQYSDVPISFKPTRASLPLKVYTDKTSEIVDLAMQLIRIPSVTACPQERLDEVIAAAAFISDYVERSGLEIRYFNKQKYPALLIGFPGKLYSEVMLNGHFDVVEPIPDDTQFQPRLDGDYLVGRGAADMKTVVATYLVWFKDRLQKGEPYPPLNLLLIGNEENGEFEPVGTRHVFEQLEKEGKTLPKLFIAGERTGESGKENFGEICTENRGIIRFDIVAHGMRSHSSQTSVSSGKKIDITNRLLAFREKLKDLFEQRLTLSNPDKWNSQYHFPFVKIGEENVYNITPEYGILGVEVRPIPGEDLENLFQEIRQLCDQNELELQLKVNEQGIRCDNENKYLKLLIQAYQDIAKEAPRIGKKLPGTSARFAPGGQGVVWGQSGIDPHGANERHFIPSIKPYYEIIEQFANLLMANENHPGE
ncbi:MAG: M20 family metallopeptidase [Anaerolineales bacterium]